MLKYLKENDFEEEIKKDKMLVDFYADWCGPCKMMGSILEEIDDIDILKVNVDEYPDIASTYGVMSIPTIILMQDGEEKTRSIGFKAKEEIEKMYK